MEISSNYLKKGANNTTITKIIDSIHCLYQETGFEHDDSDWKVTRCAYCTVHYF